MINDEIEKWGVFEESFQAEISEAEINPYTEVVLTAAFWCDSIRVEVSGFYDGNNTFKIRVMPEFEGRWQYRTKSNIPELDGKEGGFTCVAAKEGNHGIVSVYDTFHFAYADKNRYYPIGTTCYVWNYQSEERRAQTLETLKTSAFNKIRFCVFPKYYDYNRKNPDIYPFAGNERDGFDFMRPNPALFQRLEKCVTQLGEMGIEADIILFHPYDKAEWGFSLMGKEADDAYLKYIVSRLSAYHNVWWSVANEYDVFNNAQFGVKKEPEDWDRFFRILERHDPYSHLRSIHNCLKFYDYGKPWVTHCSIQRTDNFKTSENTDMWRRLYQKPVVIDECTYEGNINWGWGNISGEEMTRRFWEGAVRGGYVGHGETYTHPQDILWWSHGGELHGSSPQRIAFLRKILEEHPQYSISPINYVWDAACGGVEDKYYLFYFGFFRPSFRDFKMNENVRYKVELIDTWNMTITRLEGTYQGEFRIEMPSKQYMAVRMTAV